MKDPQILYKKAIEVREQAYAPYSNFFVGSCIETSKGNLFTGCNVENASYGVTVCSETNAICAMVAAGEREIVQIAIVIAGPGVSAPCGACRQQLNEFAKPDTLVHLFDLHGEYQQYSIKDLLPCAFGPADLGVKT